MSQYRTGLCRPAGEIRYRLRFVRISGTGTGLYILPWWRCPYVRSPAKSSVSEYGWSSTSYGVVSKREVIVIVPAFLELQRFGGFIDRGLDLIYPVCNGNFPHRWISISLGRRCEARTNQRLANGVAVFSPCRVMSTRESSVCFRG